MASPNVPSHVAQNQMVYILSVRLFGAMDVQIHGQPLPLLRTAKGKWLLALLALQPGRAVERAWLAARLWPDSDEPKALYNLRRCLCDLKASLGSAAHLLDSPSPRSLRLKLTPEQGAFVDVAAFDAAIRTGRPDEAIELYRGPLLLDCPEEWAILERDQRQEQCLQALEHLAADADRRGDHGAAVSLLRRAVLVDPARETAQRALMRALAAARDYGAVTQVYRTLRLYLQSELNLKPAPETTALYRQIRDAARRTVKPPSVRAGQSGPPPHNLPYSISPLIGREEDVQAVRARLAASRLLTLVGTGGIGKTRLALQAAADTLEEYSDGTWFVDLAAVLTPEGVAAAVAAALGVREYPGHALPETLALFLRPRCTLLLLDNCEHVTAACAELAAFLLARASELQILATSRQPLGLPGETTWRVPPLRLTDPAMPVTPEAALNTAASRLFADRAAAASSFRLTAANCGAVMDICRALDGLPLAIELAAAQTQDWTAVEIRAGLEDRFRLLIGGSPLSPARQQSLRATMDWSFALLSPAEQRLLEHLSVFRGGWSRAGAQAIAMSAEIGKFAEIGRTGTGGGTARDNGRGIVNEKTPDVPTTSSLLSSLVRKSLINTQEQEGPPGDALGNLTRYLLLETVREYAWRQLAARGAEAAAREAHLAYFCTLARDAGAALTGPDQAIWLRRLDVERENLRAALAWSAQDADCALSGLCLATSLARYWDMRGLLSEGRQWLDRLLTQAKDASAQERARALDAAGDLAYALGLFPEAGACYQAELDQAELMLSEGGAEELAAEELATEELGEEMLAEGKFNPPSASTHKINSNKIDRSKFSTYKISISRASALTGLSLVAYAQGDYTASLSRTGEALRLWRQHGDRRRIAQTLTHLGNTEVQRGAYAAARGCHEEALAIGRALGDTHYIATTIFQMGQAAWRRGNLEEASACCTEGLELGRQLSDRQYLAYTGNTLGAVALAQGEPQAAQEHHRTSLAILEEIGDQQGIAAAHYSLAAALLATGELRAAQGHLGQALRLRRETGHRRGVAECLEAYATLFCHEGHPAQAVRCGAAAEALREEIGAPLPPVSREAYGAVISAARDQLGSSGADLWFRARAAGGDIIASLVSANHSSL